MTTEQAAPTFKPKKSVALSGVTAGNTALCTVGKTGNDLHYRGYDILELADQCEFEEVAHLLVHGKLPTRAELKGYKAKLKALRGLPANVKAALEQLPASSHPMDVMRTGVSGAGLHPAGKRRPQHRWRTRHCRPPDGFAGLHAAVLVPLQHQWPPHRSGNRRRQHRRPLPAPAARCQARATAGSRP